VAEERLALLPVDRVLAGEGRRFTAAEAAERAGVELKFMIRIRRALGLSVPECDAAEYTEEDVDAARMADSFREAGLPEEGIVEVSRVIGMAMAQVADANRQLIREALVEAGDTELDVGLRFAHAAQELIPMLGPVLQYVLAAHQREMIRNDVVGRAELAAGELSGFRVSTVCFADLVEFTRLGEHLMADELAAVTGRFSEIAAEVADAPVRLVKLIGDAAMLVSADSDAILDAALTLIDEVDEEGEEFPMVRAGVARGLALPQGGDWYGHTVNLASRLTGLAYPGSVLASKDVRDAATKERYRWSNAGKRKLKGISEPVRVFRVRGDGDEPDPESEHVEGHD
jgi:adenylate cyclase